MDLRPGITGLFYVHKPGGQWRLIPTHIGNAHTLDGSWRRWRRAGSWARVRDTRRQWERQRQGRRRAPSACGADRQRIKTAPPAEDVGFDGHKQSKGRTRPMVVETLGLMIAVLVTAAHTEDRLGLVLLLQRSCAAGVKRRRKRWVEGGYDAQWLRAWVRGLKQTHQVELEGVEHSGQGLQVVPYRWVVERPFAWVLHDRRQSRDYEVWTASSEALIQMSMMRLFLKRLA